MAAPAARVRVRHRPRRWQPASTSGSITRDADGNVNGSRGTSVTGKNGNSYNGSTTVQDGTVTHTATCTNAAGETIACPSRGN